jgi:hypothetical protein
VPPHSFVIISFFLVFQERHQNDLTRRANHRHIFNIAKASPRREIGGGLFCQSPTSAQGASVLRCFSSLRGVALRALKNILSGSQKCLAPSGKSLAYVYHRKNFRARAGKSVAGFFNPTS